MNVPCLLSAILFVLGHILPIISNAKWRGKFDWEQQKQLDPDYLQGVWDRRENATGILFASGYINALAWLFFSIAMLQFIWVLSQGGTKSIGTHITISILILSGALCEWIGNFLYIGAYAASEYVASNYNLDYWIGSKHDEAGWRVLEIVHVVTVGFVYFLDAYEWFVISVSLILLYFSVQSYSATVGDDTIFTGFWIKLGLVVALISFLDFVGQIVGHHGFLLFGKISFYYSGFNRLILLPIWLVLLSRSLPVASMRFENEIEATRKAIAALKNKGLTTSPSNLDAGDDEPLSSSFGAN